MAHDLASSWKSRSAPSLSSPQATLGPRRPTGLLSSAAVELISDTGRLGTPLSRSRLGSRQGDLSASHDRQLTRPFSRSAQSSQGAWPSASSSASWPSLTDELQKPGSAHLSENSFVKGSRPTTRQNVGPSLVALRENQKKELYSQEIERKKLMQSSGNQEVMTVTTEINNAQSHQDFLKDVSAFERTLQDCGRTIRMEHMGRDPKDIEADRKAAEKAAQRDYEEKMLREARKKEQMARDPHRKIQLKLENKRRFEMDTLDKAGIPMQTIELAGGKGRQQVTLVDVRQLQSSAIGLGEPGGVRAILDLKNHRDKMDRMTSTLAVAPTLGIKTLAFVSQTWDDRYKDVIDQKHENYVEDLARKYDNMRQPKPKWLPHNHLGPKYSLKKASCKVINVNRCYRRSADLTLDEVDADAIEKPEVHEAPPEVKARARRGWTQLRGVVNYLRFLYFKHRRELRSIHCVASILQQLSEWARIRSAMQRLSSSIKLLQRTCRNFLSIRDKRLAIMTKDWQRVEDPYLTAYFKLYAVKTMEEHADMQNEAIVSSYYDKTKPLTKKQSQQMYNATIKLPTQALISREDTENMIEKSFDWRSYRIPARDRRAMLIRFYMVKSRNRIRNERNFQETIQNVVRWNREALSFLQREFGAGPPKGTEKTGIDKLFTANEYVEPPSATFWQLTDDVYLDMIAVGAEALRRREHYIDHPANKAKKLTDACFDKFCRPPRRLTKDMRLALHSEVKGGTAPVAEATRSRRRSVGASRGVRISKQNDESNNAAWDANTKSQAKPTVDLDELWNQFEPRLRDISAEIDRAENDADNEPVMP